MTPYNVPATNEQTHFNVVLCRTRVLIEKTYGTLKQRFQYLHHGLRWSPKQAVGYITACSILHNIEIARSVIFINNGIPVPQNDDAYRKRNEITHMFFFS